MSNRRILSFDVILSVIFCICMILTSFVFVAVDSVMDSGSLCIQTFQNLFHSILDHDEGIIENINNVMKIEGEQR